jgi:hypothetical protein
MWLKQFIGALGALGLMWIVQLLLFVILFTITLLVLRGVAYILTGDGIDRDPARALLALSCLLTFAFLVRLQNVARRHGWIDRPAPFLSD